jgi:hypothetical protein
VKAANDNTKRSKRLRPGIPDSNLDYGRPLAWDAENDNEEPSDPSRYVALDGVVERRA